MRVLASEADSAPLRLGFDRRLKLEFHGARITSDAGLLAYRDLDDALGLTDMAAGLLADSRTGQNGWYSLAGLLRQSVYGRLAGYEDVNDADRLGREPAMRWIVGGKAVERGGASISQMGRFETELLATGDNLAALAEMSGAYRHDASAQAAEGHRSGHGQFRQSDPRGAGRDGLQWPFWLQLLSPAARVQSVRRS